MAGLDDSELRRIVIGRVSPYIYSFKTNTLPNYLKVGDTYRPVEERLKEWRHYYKDLTEVSRHKAVVNDDIFFRDHAVHKYLQQKGVKRAAFDKAVNVFSSEFFEGIDDSDVAEAVEDVIANYQTSDRYDYYTDLKEKIEYHYSRNLTFAPRDIQQQVIEKFRQAIEAGRTNLLMYAVMRFGKSITSMWCAKAMNSKFTVIVSAKADVKSEWKQTVESHQDFKGFRFLDSSNLSQGLVSDDIFGKEYSTGSGENEICTNIVLFLTLQDLAGSSEVIKEHHRILQELNPDLLIIDETHFGARAQVLGKILAGAELSEFDEAVLKVSEDTDNLGQLDKLESISSKVKLHLSGTPYRILMGSEFEKEDIISFIQFSDIYDQKLKWSSEHLDHDEWENPYYGFPQMVRFAFNPNESSRKKLESIPGSKPSDIFTPVSTAKSGNFDEFAYKDEVIDLLQVLDGTKDDSELLSILDHDIIKSGKLARHIVIVLPYRASCDSFERLINDHSIKFKNLSNYTILNISGYNKTLESTEEVKAAISSAESRGEKTITLTVNKMLTGSTVPQWDTMIYLKSTSSPQEYDQAIFRLQSPWIEQYKSESGDLIKYDMKPQTLLIDLDPTRLFVLQEMKAFTYGVNTDSVGNEHIEEFISHELEISPILALNAEKNKLIEISATRIIDEVRKYSNERTISEDVTEIGIDFTLKNNAEIYEVISKLSEIGSKNGLNINPNEGDGEDLDGGEDEPQTDTDTEGPSTPDTEPSTDDEKKLNSIFEKQFRTYYVLILLFAFLSTTEEKSLMEVIEHLDANQDNIRIATSLGLRKNDLLLVRNNINWSILSSLDYKIQNSDFRTNDASITPVEHIDIAINKFGKLSDAEVFTPPVVVDKIYDSLDENFWSSVETRKVLDIASKSGSFARGFIQHAEAKGINKEELSDNFYSIPTSAAAYEFTRKMYTALGLNIENIAQHFTSYDLLEIFEDAHSLLSINKKFCDITPDDLRDHAKITDTESEVENLKFDAIVGNPPYQENIAGRGDQPPIYHKFLETAYSMSKVVAMIHPARFLFNAGLTPKKWNAKMLNDPHLKVIYYEQDSSKVFPNTDIKGGVVITLRNTDENYGAIGVFTSHPELAGIVEKVQSKEEPTLSQFITGRGVYRLTNVAHSEHPEVESIQSRGHKNDVGTTAFTSLKDILLFENKPDDDNQYAQVLGIPKGKRAYYWIDQRYINRPPNFEKYKVILPKANGTGAMGEMLSSPVVGAPLTAYTETFIGIGAFDTKLEAEAALKYIKSKFARTMLGVLKITQDNPKDKWSKVPMQDFTTHSEIDWTKSIPEIDKQLYKKYKLSEDEVEFIESHVKPME